MPFFRLLAIGMLSVVLVACATPRVSPVENGHVIELETLVRLPESITRLSIAERSVHELPEAGVQYRYAGDLVYHVDVFVYPVGELQRRFLIESDKQALIASEYGNFRGELAYALQQGWYENIRLVEEGVSVWHHIFEVSGEQLTVPFLVAQGEFEIEKQGVALASFVALSEFKGYFVKIRLTHPDYPGLPREMTHFTEQLFGALYRNDLQLPAISIGQGDERNEVMCLPGESMLECVSRAVRSLAPSAKARTESV